jgi:hypothetical protein
MSGDKHEKMLSTPEKQLYCWKSSSDATQDGVVKGSVCRRFKPVDFFHSPPGAPTGIAANAAAAVTSAAEVTAAALKRPRPTSTTPTLAQHSAVVHVKSSSVSGVLSASTEQNGGLKSCSDTQSRNLGFSRVESSQEAVAVSSPREIEAGPEESEYEQKRKQTIQKNKELMEKLGISNALQRAVTAVQVPAKLHTIFSPPVCLTPTTSH